MENGVTGNNSEKERPEHRQVYNIIVSKDPSWQSIIYELVTTEQLDPWNVDITILCKSYFEKVKVLEENNFHISSKMLLAAALLLRIKSEILLNKYIREIDDILFPRNDNIQKIIERIEIDENDIPILSPKTPLPRFKKVTLQELIDALDVAIRTEGRRIQKEIEKKQAERLSHVDIPKFRRINIKERIRQFYAKILTGFSNKKGELKLPYSHFTGNSKEEKIACFLPMLYLSNNGKIWLEQEKHYSEIYMYLYEIFIKTFPDHDRLLVESSDTLEEIPAEMMEKLEEFEAAVEQLENKIEKEINEEKTDLKTKKVQKINKDFENPIGDLINDESSFLK
jgi:segregation and condensation protein A